MNLIKVAPVLTAISILMYALTQAILGNATCSACHSLPLVFFYGKECVKVVLYTNLEMM